VIAPSTPTATGPRLLDGPAAEEGREPLEAHSARLGLRPPGGTWLLDALEESGLRGRGGAWFPTARKWRGVAVRASGPAVVVINASEGEPLSAKDRTLVSLRPHLVLDGAVLAAESVGADEIVVYLSRPFRAARAAIAEALAERRRAGLREPVIRVTLVSHDYVAGESSAVVRRLSGGPAKPTFTPPHPSERGVGGRPTLVQNAETLAHAALIARNGSGWFRSRGTPASPGTTLMTLSGGVHRPGVYEVDIGTSVADVLDRAGGAVSPPAGALLGGYFGSWIGPDELLPLTLDVEALARRGASLGCGVLGVLPDGGCAIGETARIIAYLAAESAGQCGPCVLGLRALADAMQRIARSNAEPADLDRIRRWARLIRGRGACNHPDGAAHHLESALDTFADHLALHLAGVLCAASLLPSLPAPRPRQRWR
jgi:NADH:ubiquinone oxidoreductase subunit F (NADH-binding)